MNNDEMRMALYNTMRSDSDFNDVGKFHKKFGLPSAEHPGPREIDKELIEFRLNFLLEELEEFASACGYYLSTAGPGLKFREDHETTKIDHTKAFDALIDLNYVSLGTAHLLGYPWPVGWNAVQQANMKKERAVKKEQSARGSLWDVVKPKEWQPPDIKSVLRFWGFDV